MCRRYDPDIDVNGRGGANRICQLSDTFLFLPDAHPRVDTEREADTVAATDRRGGSVGSSSLPCSWRGRCGQVAGSWTRPPQIQNTVTLRSHHSHPAGIGAGIRLPY